MLNARLLGMISMDSSAVRVILVAFILVLISCSRREVAPEHSGSQLGAQTYRWNDAAEKTSQATQRKIPSWEKFEATPPRTHIEGQAPAENFDVVAGRTW